MQVEILVINESNLNYQLLRQVAMTVPPDNEPVSELYYPVPSESDFQMQLVPQLFLSLPPESDFQPHGIVSQFWTVFAVTTQILY